MPKFALFVVLSVAWFGQAAILGTDSWFGGWGPWTWARIAAFALAAVLCVLLWATRWRVLTTMARFWGTMYLLLAAVEGNLSVARLPSVEHLELECATAVLGVTSAALFVASLKIEGPRPFRLTPPGDGG